MAANGVGVGQMRRFGMTKCVLGVVSVDLGVTKFVLMLLSFGVVLTCVLCDCELGGDNEGCYGGASDVFGLMKCALGAAKVDEGATKSVLSATNVDLSAMKSILVELSVAVVFG